MASTTERTTQFQTTFTPRFGTKLVLKSSTRTVPPSQKSRSFVAALLKALSAFAA